MKIICKLTDENHLFTGNYAVRTDVLGPYDRFVLWVQGCKRNCKGCVAPEMQSLTEGKALKIDFLSEQIIKSDTEGLTISGGEPFLQADKLCRLIDNVKAVKDIGIIIYTGFSVDELERSEEHQVRELIKKADVIIDGEYIEELNDDLGLRGSSNQRVIYITDRYKDYLPYSNPEKRKTRFITQENGMYMIGVPTRSTYNLLQKLKGQ